VAILYRDDDERRRDREVEVVGDEQVQGGRAVKAGRASWRSTDGVLRRTALILCWLITVA